MTNQEQYELICEKAKKYDRLVEVLDKIRAEIEASKWTDRHIWIERNALADGLDKALEIIDKYRKEQE